MKVNIGGRGPPATSRMMPCAFRVGIPTNRYGTTTAFRFTLHNLKRVEGDRDRDQGPGGFLVFGDRATLFQANNLSIHPQLARAAIIIAAK